jgi:hypothetical protein
MLPFFLTCSNLKRYLELKSVLHFNRLIFDRPLCVVQGNAAFEHGRNLLPSTFWKADETVIYSFFKSALPIRDRI